MWGILNNFVGMMRAVKIAYCRIENISFVKFSPFSISGPICVAIIWLFDIFIINYYINWLFTVINVSVLKGDSENNENKTTAIISYTTVYKIW